MPGKEPIAVIGLGNWGTALAHHVALKGHKVVAWTRDADVVQAIRDTKRHPTFLADVTLSENIVATTNIADCAKAQIIIYALPSATLASVVLGLTLQPGTILISAVKGLERDTLLTPVQFFERHYGSIITAAVISGPSFAADVIRQRPCGLVAACKDSDISKQIATLLSGASMRVYTSTDTVGVEVGGVVKNVIAVAAGVVDGLDLGESARAGLITRGLAEMMRLAEAMGGERLTLSGLSGLGDLIMTATSPASRNRTLGYRLGKGESLNAIVQTIGSVAEAVSSTPIVLRLASQHGVEMPICHQVGLLINQEITPHELVQRLLQRPLKSE